jgi:hypothetical protein
MILRFSFALLVLIQIAAAQSASMPTYWRYSYPNAEFLAGIDLAAVSNSSIGQTLKQEFEKAGFSAMVSKNGFDFIRGADQVLLSGAAPAGAKKSNVAKGVASVQGRFDVAAVRATLRAQGARPTSYQGVEAFLADKDGDPIMMAIISPQALVVGDASAVRAALGNQAAGPTSLLLRGLQLAASNDIWLVSNTPPDALAARGGASTEDDLFSQIRSFEGGISLRQGLGISFNVATKTPQNAQKAAGGFQALLDLAKSGASKNADAEKFFRKLHFDVQDNRVQLSVQFTQAEVARLIQEIQSGVRTQAAGSGAIRVRPAVKGQTSWTLADAAPAPQREPEPEPEPDPSKPLVVKIFNADEGSREVDINKRP